MNPEFNRAVHKAVDAEINGIACEGSAPYGRKRLNRCRAKYWFGASRRWSPAAIQFLSRPALFSRSEALIVQIPT